MLASQCICTLPKASPDGFNPDVNLAKTAVISASFAAPKGTQYFVDGTELDTAANRLTSAGVTCDANLTRREQTLARVTLDLWGVTALGKIEFWAGGVEYDQQRQWWDDVSRCSLTFDEDKCILYSRLRTDPCEDTMIVGLAL